MFCNGQNGYIRLYSYPVTDSYRNLWDVPNLLLQKISAPNFTATTKLTFKPTKKYTGERTGLVVMGLDYAGLFVENTKDGLVLSQSVCDEADRGSLEKTNASVSLEGNTVYLKINILHNGQKKCW